MEQFILILELIGTLAFAASGAMIGIKKKMDLFGVCILALTTAVGGGVIRDLILGNTPPTTFKNPIYAIVALGTALTLFFSRMHHIQKYNTMLFDKAMFWMDTVGLGIFTVTGIRTAYTLIPQSTVFLLVFVGVVTGVGGGVLRDMMAGNTPYIFVKHIYACASLVGALVCGIMWNKAGKISSMLVGCGLVILIRVLSAHYHWNLPKAHG